MLSHHRTSPALALSRAFIALGALAGTLQAATTFLPSAPSGFTEGGGDMSFDSSSSLASESGDVLDRILEGFKFSTTLIGTYDTNVNRVPDTATRPAEDDFILTLGGRVGYLSKASEFTFGGHYRASYDSYFSQTDFSGFNQGAGIIGNYDGGRIQLSFNGGIDKDRGVNRNYSSVFIEQTVTSLALTGRYAVSRKTSISGSVNHRYTAAEGNYSDTQSLDLGMSALWHYSPLTEIGPGIRYTLRTGDSQVERTSVGPTFNVNYQLSTKVNLNARAGVDFTSFSNGATADPDFSTAVSLAYNASRLWGMNFSIYRDTEADPSRSGSFYEVTAARIAYLRKVRRAIWETSLSYEVTSSEIPGTSQALERNFFGLSSSMGMKIFRDTTTARAFVRYSDLDGLAFESWNAVQIGMSLNRSF